MTCTVYCPTTPCSSDLFLSIKIVYLFVSHSHCDVIVLHITDYQVFLWYFLQNIMCLELLHFLFRMWQRVEHPVFQSQSLLYVTLNCQQELNLLVIMNCTVLLVTTTGWYDTRRPMLLQPFSDLLCTPFELQSFLIRPPEFCAVVAAETPSNAVREIW